jgi:flagellar hook-length control protein FliK
MSPEVQQSLWSQVQSGILTNLRPGETQVTLNLNPPELGQVDLTLSVKGQHLEITAIASQAEAAQVVQAGVQQLVQALANQGFILNQFQVRHQEVTASLPGVRELGKPPEPQRDKTNPGSPRQSRKVDRFV